MAEIPLARLRRANAVYFFISGFGYSSWTSRIPVVKESLKLNDAHFGTLLFMLPVGLLITMPFTGKLLDHFKSRTIMFYGAMIYNVVLVCLGFSPFAWVLAIVLFFFGASRNLMNLSMNAQAIGVQALYQRSIMSSFHAVWSLAGFAGAAIGYVMVANHIIPLLSPCTITGIPWIRYPTIKTEDPSFLCLRKACWFSLSSVLDQWPVRIPCMTGAGYISSRYFMAPTPWPPLLLHFIWWP